MHIQEFNFVVYKNLVKVKVWYFGKYAYLLSLMRRFIPFTYLSVQFKATLAAI